MLAKGSTAIDGLSVGTDAVGLRSAVSRSGFQLLKTNVPAPSSTTTAAKAAASERRVRGLAEGALAARRHGPAAVEHYFVDAHRPGDVLEGLLPEIDELFFDFVANLPIGILRYANPANLADTFEPRGDIDAVAHQIAVALLDDIAQMNADTKFDTALRRKAGISLHHAALHFDGAAHGVDDAAKFDDGSIARALDHAPVMHGDGRIDHVAAERAKPRQGAILIRSHEAAVAHHVGDQDRRDLARFGHRSSQ